MKRPAQQAGHHREIAYKNSVHQQGAPVHAADTAPVTTSRIETAARWYISLGYPVFPLVHRRKFPFAKKNPEDPDEKAGQKLATLDIKVALKMFKERSRFNLAIVPPPNVFAVDVDDLSQMPGLLKDFPELHGTSTHTTPRGGYHFFLRAPDGFTASQGGDKMAKAGIPGVDIKGLARGYLVAPPSIVYYPETGKMGEYKVIRRLVPPSELPMASSKLLKLIEEKERKPRSSRPIEVYEQSNAYVTAAINNEILAVANAAEGTRNNTLNVAAVNLGSLAGAGMLKATEVITVLLLAAEECGLPDREARATIHSGLKFGLEHPRQVKR